MHVMYGAWREGVLRELLERVSLGVFVLIYGRDQTFCRILLIICPVTVSLTTAANTSAHRVLGPIENGVFFDISHLLYGSSGRGHPHLIVQAHSVQHAAKGRENKEGERGWSCWLSRREGSPPPPPTSLSHYFTSSLTRTRNVARVPFWSFSSSPPFIPVKRTSLGPALSQIIFAKRYELRHSWNVFCRRMITRGRRDLSAHHYPEIHTCISTDIHVCEIANVQVWYIHTYSDPQ
jgi:hypothetical protein